MSGGRLGTRQNKLKNLESARLWSLLQQGVFFLINQGGRDMKKIMLLSNGNSRSAVVAMISFLTPSCVDS